MDMEVYATSTGGGCTDGGIYQCRNGGINGVVCNAPPPVDPGSGCCCFVADSIVAMADGTLRRLADVRVGEFVLGRLGEANEVLALNRPLLGGRKLFIINCDHYTTDEHTHWGLNGPQAISLENHEKERNKYHNIILADGSRADWQFTGLDREIAMLVKGNLLVGIEGTSRAVKSIVRADRAEDFQLYNLVLGGSHTYFVDGYLVAGWPREDDFDYDRWTAKTPVMARPVDQAPYSPVTGLSSYRRFA